MNSVRDSSYVQQTCLHVHPTLCLASKASVKCTVHDISKSYRSVIHWNDNFSALNIVEDFERTFLISKMESVIKTATKKKDKEMHPYELISWWNLRIRQHMRFSQIWKRFDHKTVIFFNNFFCSYFLKILISFSYGIENKF